MAKPSPDVSCSPRDKYNQHKPGRRRYDRAAPIISMIMVRPLLFDQVVTNGTKPTIIPPPHIPPSTHGRNLLGQRAAIELRANCDRLFVWSYEQLIYILLYVIYSILSILLLLGFYLPFSDPGTSRCGCSHCPQLWLS